MPRVIVILVGGRRTFERHPNRGDFNNVVLPTRMRPGAKLVDAQGRPINERGQLVDLRGRPLRRRG